MNAHTWHIVQGLIVAVSLSFLVMQIGLAIRDAWRRREFRRAVDVVRARNLRLFGAENLADVPPPSLPRGEYRVVVTIPSRRGGKTEAARIARLSFPDRPIIPTKDAHFGE